MYIIKDRVEVAHIKDIGGTVYISIYTKDFGLVEDIRDIIDRLDHSFITDKKSSIRFSKRFFLIDKCSNIYKDIYDIIFNMLTSENIIDRVKKIAIEYDGVIYKKFKNPVTHIIDYNYRG